MIKLLRGNCFLLLATLLLAGCSDSNPEAPLAGEAHPQGWIDQHASAANADLASCQSCHGAGFTGSGNAVSCFSCHPSGPPFALHPAWWGTDALNEHLHFHNAVNPAERLSWTTCATADCHGVALHGGTRNAPSCFSASFVNGSGATNGCHAGGPPAPHVTGGAYADPALHGAAAKDSASINESMGNYCLNCHGRPTNRFDGGMVSDPAILNLAQANCAQAACHPDATAHPTNWVRADNPVRFHSTVSSQTITASCALCHNTSAAGAGPFVGAPSCYSTNFTNADGTTAGCHPTGPSGAPHAVPYTDAALHGPAAKANLIVCQACHAEAGGQGSNPRFNTPIGSLLNGCEGCHTAGAHPSGVDRWTFQYDTTATRRTHFAAGNVLNACALCHNVSAGNIGGTAPACTGCHVSAPLFRLKCNVCHLHPPAGAADQTGASTPVAHGLVTTFTPHEACAICHGARDDGSGRLIAKAAGYVLFNSADVTLNQGGDHLDGHIEMNGPSGVGAGYNATNFGCDNACHGNNLTHRLPNASGMTIEFGNYGSGSLACNTCHGYPPDGTADLTGATPVNHLFGDLGVTLKASHNDCLLCHGTKDDGTGSHSPAANYSVATDHNTGSINMNSATSYNQANFGCDAACHANDAGHQLSNSALPVVLADYGGGGAGACASCHDTGVGGAPIVIQSSSSHVSTLTCEDCHTGHNAGTVIVPNNATVGINYGADHGNGISLGSATVSGATEAQICWTCHASNSISEWGPNSDTNGGAPNYNPGTLNQSSWINATWTSATALFSYKTGTIMSTHSANPAAVAAGIDAVATIRCSYCHDVHNVGAQGFRKGYDNGGNPPYLIGTWMGNPYPEDGAPLVGSTYLPTLNRFGAVPRGNTSSNAVGGYQIDQNNGNPTATWTANASAGLCECCHGNGDGNWTAAEISGLNTFGTAGPNAAWIGTNGHANAVLGGNGVGANIFRNTDRTASAIVAGQAGAGNPTMAYRHAVGSRGYGFRPVNANGTEGWYLLPSMNLNDRPYGFNFYDWGATVDDATTDSQYHKFSCSKCHNPHASRLPRLLITNCLDTKHNTWDTKAGVDTIPIAASSVGTAVSPENSNTGFSNATSAQNCHRLRDPVNYPQAKGSGWNRVSPWTTPGTQDNGTIP
ncbi:MAG: hypothetical protein A2091_06645 [Desulfuromonadales bacterium GWD2_61_12]|nr:MAG: hypothetical protein A2005_09840 [Desulfuromonadales bacterium GWC2_61_20]OGR35538.1 MAG: hypothetical protein A2091_06645 [Desulfuromonadales bacterium GWD2_61_12]HAD04106.1 hypothetical protein [Desulfuromonas sp.]HBT83273.1 hypothetical protein [Desulfuromonas sp.]